MCGLGWLRHENKIVMTVSKNLRESSSNQRGIPLRFKHVVHVQRVRLVELIEKEKVADAGDRATCARFPLPDRGKRLATNGFLRELQPVNWLGQRCIPITAFAIGDDAEIGLPAQHVSEFVDCADEIGFVVRMSDDDEHAGRHSILRCGRKGRARKRDQ